MTNGSWIVLKCHDYFGVICYNIRGVGRTQWIRILIYRAKGEHHAKDIDSRRCGDKP